MHAITCRLVSGGKKFQTRMQVIAASPLYRAPDTTAGAKGDFGLPVIGVTLRWLACTGKV